jgi:hypothetical protein
MAQGEGVGDGVRANPHPVSGRRAGADGSAVVSTGVYVRILDGGAGIFSRDVVENALDGNLERLDFSMSWE